MKVGEDLEVQQRIGCLTCDWVGGRIPRANELELHTERCPRCGRYTLHEYAIPGSWPSDYPIGKPPCRW